MTEAAVERAFAAVRHSGGRLTVPTRAVVTALAGSRDHLTADDLIAEIEQLTPGIAESTIYRVVQRLGELGIVEHVHTGVGPAIYHLHEDIHAHLVCNTCGAIIDIPIEELDPLRSALAGTYDFTLQPHHSALLGRCKDCTAKAPRPPESIEGTRCAARSSSAS